MNQCVIKMNEKYYIEKCLKTCELGRGYTENIYQNLLCSLLTKDNLECSKEEVLCVKFEGIYIGSVRTDIILKNEGVVIECKAINNLLESHLPQIITYMKILNYSHGIFVNFTQDPSKPPLQMYIVTKNDDEYIFKNYNNKDTIILGELGERIKKN